MSFFSKIKKQILSTKRASATKYWFLIFFILLISLAIYTNNSAMADPIDPTAAIGEAGEVKTGEKSSSIMENVIIWFLNPILLVFLRVVSIIYSIAETLFQWIIDPANLNSIIDNAVIYETWRAVRDIFNVAFILTLLFSAFATIFQASSSYNYKKVLVNLIIMALLVNFSYPIARFIIDASNVIMYSFLNSMMEKASFMDIINNSGIKGIIIPEDPEPFFLVALIAFTFILSFTLLSIAILLVIRTISLAIYVIFSPIAFVGTILPNSKMASAAKDWWRDFLKHCFAGPIMIFYLLVAVKMIRIISAMGGKTIREMAEKHATGMGAIQGSMLELISQGAFFSLPIVILWLGIIESQKSGIAGANAIVNKGLKAMHWTRRAPIRAAKWSAAKTGVPQAIAGKYKKYTDDSWFNKKFGKDAVEARSARLMNIGPVKVPEALDKVRTKEIEAAHKKHKMDELSPDELNEIIKNTDNKYDTTTVAAAIKQAQAKGWFDTSSNTDHKEAFKKIRKEFTSDSLVFKQFNNKLREKNFKDSFEHIENEDKRREAMLSFAEKGNINVEKLDAESLKDDALVETLVTNGLLSASQLEKLRGTSYDHESAIKKSLDIVAGRKDKDTGKNKYDNVADLERQKKAITGTTDQDNKNRDELEKKIRIAKEVQLLYATQNGKVHSSIELDDGTDSLENMDRKEARSKVFGSLKEKGLERMEKATAEKYADEILSSMDPNKLKSNLQSNMKGEVATKLMERSKKYLEDIKPFENELKQLEKKRKQLSESLSTETNNEVRTTLQTEINDTDAKIKLANRNKNQLNPYNTKTPEDFEVKRLEIEKTRLENELSSATGTNRISLQTNLNQTIMNLEDALEARDATYNKSPQAQKFERNAKKTTDKDLQHLA